MIIEILGTIYNCTTEAGILFPDHILLLKSVMPNQVSSMLMMRFPWLSKVINSIAYLYLNIRFLGELVCSETDESFL